MAYARSLTFDTAPLPERKEILGAPVVTLDVASDKPLANLAVRLCEVRPDGTSLRVSFGVLNLAHRDSHESPAALVPGQRYQVRIQLNDEGCAFSAGHRVRVAISTAYWPMIWPAPELATVTVFGGTLELPVRPFDPADAALPPLPEPETAAPEPTSRPRPGVVRIDRLGLDVGTEASFDYHLEADDALSAECSMRQVQTVSRGDWRTRIETATRMSCTREAFLLRATLRAWDGDEKVCAREWDISVPRDFV